MEFKNHLGYKVYENGDVVNSKGILLKPQIQNGWAYYEIQNKKIGVGTIVLFAFGIYPDKHYNRLKPKRKDGNQLNNSLENLSW